MQHHNHGPHIHHHHHHHRHVYPYQFIRIIVLLIIVFVIVIIRSFGSHPVGRTQVATSLLREAINAKLQPSMSATANVVLTSFARREEQGMEV